MEIPCPWCETINYVEPPPPLGEETPVECEDCTGLYYMELTQDEDGSVDLDITYEAEVDGQDVMCQPTWDDEVYERAVRSQTGWKDVS